MKIIVRSKEEKNITLLLPSWLVYGRLTTRIATAAIATGRSSNAATNNVSFNEYVSSGSLNIITSTIVFLLQEYPSVYSG